ncbi:MAG: phage head-tail connector protein [Oscillospiraceae bacterium]|jgi:hypothetical protein|nr:phage head-tail connector protein [Oscillospiraceae bacterium]
MTQTDRLKQRLAITDAGRDALLAELLTEARDFMLSYTGRTNLPDGLLSCQVNIAVVWFNRQGIEGMSAADEGGVKRTVESLPEYIRRELDQWRVVRTIGGGSR